MRKGFTFLSLYTALIFGAFAADNYIPKRFNTVTSHKDVYPYRLNNAQPSTSYKTMSAKTVQPVPASSNTSMARTASVSSNSGATGTASTRRVVQRPITTNVQYSNNNVARAASNNNSMNVVSRNSRPVQTRGTARASTRTTTSSTTEKLSSQECFANYKQCMESYCEREDTPYNRCYCSAKLSQIDSKYQDKIDSLIQQIIKLRYTSTATSEDIQEY